MRLQTMMSLTKPRSYSSLDHGAVDGLVMGSPLEAVSGFESVRESGRWLHARSGPKIGAGGGSRAGFNSGSL